MLCVIFHTFLVCCFVIGFVIVRLVEGFDALGMCFGYWGINAILIVFARGIGMGGGFIAFGIVIFGGFRLFMRFLIDLVGFLNFLLEIRVGLMMFASKNLFLMAFIHIFKIFSSSYSMDLSITVYLYSFVVVLFLIVAFVLFFIKLLISYKTIN